MTAPVAAPTSAARLSPRLRALLAAGWFAIVIMVWLAGYDGWLAPLQAAHLLKVSLPALAPGPHWGEWALGRLLDVTVLAVLVAGALAAGSLIVERLVAERGLLVTLFSLAVGFWVLSVVVLALGLVRTSLVPAALLLAGLRFLGAGRGCRWHLSGTPERATTWVWLMGAVVVVAALLSLPGALAPPFEYDALEYHLGAPAEYLRAGRIGFLPHNFYSNLPQLTEMLYLLTLACRTDAAATLLHWGCGVLTAVAIYAVGARLWSRWVGATAAALFAALPFGQDLGQTARIDLVTTFFAVLGFGGLLLWARTERDLPTTGPIPTWHRGYFWLAALATGAAVATKWTAIPIVLVPVLLGVAFITRSARRTILFGLVAAGMAAPWLLKNGLLAGNPVYPLFCRWLPHPSWSVEQAAVFARRHYPAFDLAGWWQLVERPWQYAVAEPFAVPLLLATAPLALWGLRSADRSRRWLVGLLATAFLGWYLGTFRPWRFLYPALPLAALLGGIGLLQLERWHRGWGGLVRWGAFAVMLLGLSMMATVDLVDAGDYQQLPPRLNFLQYNLGRVKRDEFTRAMGGGMFAPVLWMNEHLPESAKILYIGEARVYYARHEVRWSTAFDQHPLTEWAAEVTEPEELADALRAHGITHVYINAAEWQRLERGYDYLAGLDKDLLARCLSQFAYPVFERGPVVVYALTE